MFKKLITTLFWKYCTPKDEEVRLMDDQVEAMFKSLGGETDLISFLKALLKMDKSRYFGAIDDKSRYIIKGEYLRTLYLLRQVQPKEAKESKKTKPKVEAVDTKIAGRYGSEV